MPRRNRCVLPGVPHHITQRGVNRTPVFETSFDRATYLRLLRENLVEARVHILGWCLMTNHIHLIALPADEDSLAVLLRRVHGRYAQYFNVRTGRSGHLWQNRYFACALGPGHVWCALSYVDRNPIRAHLAPFARDYPWSSAAAHLTGLDPTGLLDTEWWERENLGAQWQDWLARDEPEVEQRLIKCTYAGKPFGEDQFVDEASARFGRYWRPGRPRSKSPGHQTGPLAATA